MKIIFIGTPEFGAIVLEELIKGSYPPILVISSPDKLVGRRKVLTPPPVKLLAEKYKISVLQPEKILDTKYQMQNTKPDLIIVAAYGQILPKEILEIPKYGSLNIHPSPLPRWRGPSPLQYTILNGDKETGITIILMDEKMDHGKIISNSKFLISNKEITYPELQKELAGKGAKLLLETIPKWIKGEIKEAPQDESGATYSKILKKEDGRIDWRKPAEEIERQIRAFNPWPGSFAFWQRSDKLIKIEILKARVYKPPTTIAYPIGKTLVVPQNELAVQCGKEFSVGVDDFLVVEKLQMEGKKEMNSEDFIRGFSDFIGTILSQRR